MLQRCRISWLETLRMEAGLFGLLAWIWMVYLFSQKGSIKSPKTSKNDFAGCRQIVLAAHSSENTMYPPKSINIGWFKRVQHGSTRFFDTTKQRPILLVLWCSIVGCRIHPVLMLVDRCRNTLWACLLLQHGGTLGTCDFVVQPSEESGDG